MRASLHFYTENSDEPVFYQILEHDVQTNDSNVFEYDQRDYNDLDSKAQKDFDSYRLKLGKYTVLSSRIEKNEYWGELRHLFLKPIYN
jgi:hypothetical protein